MDWFKRLLGWETEVSTPEEPGERVTIDQKHAVFDQSDQAEVTILIKIRFRDGREHERHERISRKEIPSLAQELMADVTIREAVIFQEVSYHHKSFDGDSDAKLIATTATAAVLGVAATANLKHGL